MKPIFYEIKRTLTSKFVIIMIVAIVGLTSLLAYEDASTYSPVSVPSTPELNFGYFINNGNLTIVGYAHDAYGKPDPRITVNYQYNGINYKVSPLSNGFVNATIPLGSTPPRTVNISVNYSYVQFRAVTSSSPVTYNINTSYSYSGLQIIRDIFNPSNNSNLGFIAFYIGANGSAAPSMNFYISPINLSKISTINPDALIKNASFNLTASGFIVRTFYPQVTASGSSLNYSLIVKTNGLIEPVSGSKSPLVILGRLSFYTPMTQKDLQSLVFAGTSEILGFLIPILSVFAAYLTYGKDRTSGVIESVIKRPITRGQLINSRFLSNSVAIIGSVALSVIIADLIIHHYFGLYLSASFTLYFIWTYIVEGLAFLAIVYLFSHITKSQGSLLGGAIALFVVMDLFWSIIPIAILSALRISPSSNAYISASVAFDYASPAGYSTLVQALFTNKIGFVSSNTINPSLFGITAPILIIAGILWMIVPFFLAYWLATTRD